MCKEQIRDVAAGLAQRPAQMATFSVPQMRGAGRDENECCAR